MTFRIAKFQKRVYHLIIMGMLFSSVLKAQTGKQILLSGIIKDNRGEPVVGASIFVKNTTNGTTSDMDGKFQLSASEGSTLIISFIGYITQEISVNTKTNLVIVLEEDKKLLEEVVVIGYGNVKKGDITGSLTTIKPDNLNKGIQLTAQDALIGKVAGVNIVPGDGSPGSTGTIRIRMGASLSASNDPLIVIDGITVSGSAPLSSINPNDIESFTVLKDASATAIYGSRASNGVIIITTKKGNSTPSKLKINYTSNYSLTQICGYYRVLNADEYRSVFAEKANPPASFSLGTASTDWQNEIYRKGYGLDQNISVSGNTFNIPYRASVGYINQDGTLKSNNYNRLNADLSLSPSFFDKHLTIDMHIKGSLENNNPAISGAIGSATFFDPTRPIYQTYPDDMGLGYFMWLNSTGTPINLAPSNPIADLELIKRKSVTKRSLGNLSLNYKIHGLEDLILKVSLGYDIRKNRYDETVPDKAPSMYTGNRNDGRGRIYWSESDNKNYLFNSVLNYSKEINEKNLISAMAGYEWQRFWYRNDSETIVRDVVDNSQPDEDHLYLLSVFTRLNYSFNQKILITATLRADATSRFAPQNHWGYFPSFALAYRLNEEKFLKQFNALTDLKVRLSYGQTGQQAIGGYHPYLGTYTISTNDVRYLFGNEWVNMYRPNGYDPNIKWETTTTYNAGIDYGFMKNRISGTFDIFKRYTKDLLNEIFIPAGSNFTNSFSTNIGNMEGHGFELGLNLIPIKNKNWEWSVDGNFTYSISKITKLNVIDKEDSWVNTGTISRRSYQIHKVGEMPNTFFLLRQAYDDNGKPIEGKYVAKDGTITDVQTDANKYITGKSSRVPYYYGVSSKLKYKNFDIGINGHGSFGNYVFNYQEAKQSLMSLFSSEGVSGNISKMAMDRGFKQEQYFSDLFLEDGSFFRIDNITMGYTFNKLWKTIDAVRFAFSAQNIALLTKYSGVDPEIYDGIDNSIYQRPRIYTLSLNINF